MYIRMFLVSFGGGHIFPCFLHGLGSQGLNSVKQKRRRNESKFVPFRNGGSPSPVLVLSGGHLSPVVVQPEEGEVSQPVWGRGVPSPVLVLSGGYLSPVVILPGEGEVF